MTMTAQRNDWESAPSPRTHFRPAPRTAGLLLVSLMLCFVASCNSVSVKRDTLTTGTYSSRGWSFTLLGQDIPRPALMIARANAADIQRPDLRIEKEWVTPNLGYFDWLLDIVGFRVAKVTGTWGLPAEESTE